METALRGNIAVTSGDGRVHMASLQVLHSYGKQRFRMSPMSEIESDLKVIHRFQPRAHRIFLTGANPFVLTVNRLTDIALLIRKYVGEGKPTIGCFARITDITKKSVDDLRQLHHLGFDFLTIGVESGDTDTLARVNKGYTAEDILEQCSRKRVFNTWRHGFV